MIINIKIKKFIEILTLVFLTMLLWSVSSFEIFNGSSTRYFIVFILVVISFCSKFFLKQKKFHIDYKILIIWGLFVLFVLVSNIYNNASIIPSVEYMLIFVLYFFVLQFVIQDEKLLLKSLFINGNLILIYSFLNDSNFIIPYSGFYRNTNTFGLQLCPSFIASIFIIVNSHGAIKKLLFILNSCIFLFFIYLSGSRSCLAICFFSFFSLLIYIMKNKEMSKVKFIVSIISFCILFVLFFIYYNDIYDFFYKIIYKYDTSSIDISSGRFDRQISALNEMTIFGTNSVKIHPFNDFILTGTLYGFGAMILHIINYIFFFTLSLKHFLHDKSYENLFYLVMIVSLIFLSFFEEVMGLFGIPLVMITFISIGLLAKKY